MKCFRTNTITITREEYAADGVPGRYLIDSDGSRWYEVSYCPFPFHTTNRRLQIEHTDMHEKAIAAIEYHAERVRSWPGGPIQYQIAQSRMVAQGVTL